MEMPTLEVEKSEETETLKKPQFVSEQTTVANKMETVAIPKEGIKVVATRKGFYNQNRISTGKKFYVSKFEELGTWMICEDPAMEQKRLEFFKNKKARK